MNVMIYEIIRYRVEAVTSPANTPVWSAPTDRY